LSRARGRVAAAAGVLALVVACQASAGAERVASGVWSGFFTLPAGADPADLVVELRGGRATVALPAGHAAHVVVPARASGTRLRFALPGRPAPVAFDGRVRGGVLSGTVRQGSLRGAFSLRRRAPAGRAARQRYLGAYALEDGRTLAVAELPASLSDYPTARFKVTDLGSGEVRGLFGAGPEFALGAALAVRDPAAGAARFARDGSTVVVGGVAGRRLAVRQLEVRFRSGAVTLAGTLTLPAGPGPNPAIALLHGSGPTPRGLVQDYAWFFASRGLAVLAYDKRGAGQSGGSFPGDSVREQDVATYAGDAIAAVEFLAAQPKVDRARVGLWGVSQAGWIIPVAATRSPLVSFAVVSVGPTVTVGEQVLYASLTTAGTGPPAVPRAEIERRIREPGAATGFDPAPAIARLGIPVLWLYGGVDQHVPTGHSVEILERIEAATGADLTWAVFPRGQHFLIEGDVGLIEEIARSTRFVPGLFTTIADWLRARKIAG
jgi:dienelactone hydrolase